MMAKPKRKPTVPHVSAQASTDALQKLIAASGATPTPGPTGAVGPVSDPDSSPLGAGANGPSGPAGVADEAPATSGPIPADALRTLNDRLDEPLPATPEPEPETVQIANLEVVEEKTLPGFAMSDEPLPDPTGPTGPVRDPGLDTPSGLPFHPDRIIPPAGIVDVIDPFAPRALDGQIMPPDEPMPVYRGIQAGIRYESRIRILEAFQYPGVLKDAPEWVDRNWAAYAPDWDPLRNIQPGPALRVPTARGDEVLARPGDYVVRQEVVLAHGVEPDVQVEVWAREQFERTFIPEL